MVITMRKLRIALSLLLVFAFALLTACGGNTGDTSSADRSGDYSAADSVVESSTAADSSVTESSEPNSGTPDSSEADSSETDSREPEISIPDSSEPESSEESGVTSDYPTVGYQPLNYEYMKGIWLYQYKTQSLFKDSGVQRNEADYREKVKTICSNLSRDGYNTLFLQVRGHGDSFYPSELFPPTTFVVNSYTDSFVYDPLEIFCETAHEYKISLHAWINPYRLLTASQMSKVPEKYAIGKWYNEKEGDYIVCVNGRYYCNPAYAEVQQLVIDGAVEICRNYEVDGIHIDDYFYPEGADDSFDSIAYAALGNGRALKSFRFESVNSLVRGLYSAVHTVNEDLLFGVSPAGNINANRGYLCADVDTWCANPGYIDYIAPQAYWSFSHSQSYAKYNICSQNWARLIKCDSVKLIMGMGLYRTINPTDSSTDPDWYNCDDNIKRMLEYTYNDENAAGFIMFDYESLYNIFTGEYRTENKAERENFLPLLKG